LGTFLLPEPNFLIKLERLIKFHLISSTAKMVVQNQTKPNSHMHAIAQQTT
jgi:hypothetical protein